LERKDPNMRFLLRATTALFFGVGVGGCTPPTPSTPPQSFSSEFPEPQGRALEPEDYYRVKDLRGIRPSPDGAWVVLAVSLPVEETNGDVHEVWLVPGDASAPPRHILHRGQDVMAPDWTAGGRLFYTRDGRWSIDPADPTSPPRPEPSDTPMGNGSPDGFWVASLEDLPAMEDVVPALTAFELRHEERFQGVQFDWLNFQRDGQPFPVPDPTANPPREVVITPVEGGASLEGDATAEARTLTELGMRPSSPIWHPDSRVLAFTADPEWENELRYGRPDIWLVTIDGESIRLTDDGWTYGSLSFSPDGAFLSYTGGYGTDMVKDQRLDHGGPRDLFLIALEDGLPAASGTATTGTTSLPTPVNLTAEWDLDPSGPIWSPDSDFIYFRAEKSGGTHLFRVAAAGGPVEQITHGERSHDGIQISEDFSTMVYTVGSFETPPDAYAAELDGMGERRLTDLYRDLLDGVSLSRAERLVYPSYDGTTVEGWILYPYGYDPADGPYPMIVHSHGGPHSASGYGFNFKHQLFAANGYFVLQTNFRSSTGYGVDFKWGTWGAWGDKDGEDVMAGIDYAISNFSIDPGRVASIGHSYGGFMTNWLISRYPDRFAAAVAGAGIVNWVSDYGTADIARTKETEFFGSPWEMEALEILIRQSPLTYAGEVQAPTLFVHGELDQRVPYSEAEQMFVALKKNGVPARVIQYEGQAHGIRGHWNNVHRMMNELRWFDRWMKGEGMGGSFEGQGGVQ
jgi:dipeptidyl aminopeptidase/acylaminoacyl peptidase